MNILSKIKGWFIKPKPVKARLDIKEFLKNNPPNPIYNTPEDMGRAMAMDCITLFSKYQIEKYIKEEHNQNTIANMEFQKDAQKLDRICEKQSLNQQLAHAVANEDYHAAASIKKQIDELENE